MSHSCSISNIIAGILLTLFLSVIALLGIWTFINVENEQVLPQASLSQVERERSINLPYNVGNFKFPI